MYTNKIISSCRWKRRCRNGGRVGRWLWGGDLGQTIVNQVEKKPFWGDGNCSGDLKEELELWGSCLAWATAWNLWTRSGPTGKSEPTWFFLNLALHSADFPCFCFSFTVPSLSFNISSTRSSKSLASHGFADCTLCLVICLGPCWCVGQVFYTSDRVEGAFESLRKVTVL